jgi:hypothetical protein
MQLQHQNNACISHLSSFRKQAATGTSGRTRSLIPSISQDQHLLPLPSLALVASAAIYFLAELLEFAAFIKLRISKPDLPRPYKSVHDIILPTAA